MVNSLLIENIIEIHQCDEVRKIVSTIKKKFLIKIVQLNEKLRI